MWSDRPGGGSPAEDRGEGGSHHLLREGGSGGGGDAPRTDGQEGTLPSAERTTVLCEHVTDLHHKGSGVNDGGGLHEYTRAEHMFVSLKDEGFKEPKL